MSSLYKPNIPTGTIELDEDYINLQNNFQQLDTTYKVNHVALTDNSTSNGAHTYVEMRNQGGLPPALKAQEGTIYTKIVNAVSEMFYTPDNSTNEYQLTRTISAQIAKFATGLAYGTPPATFTQTGGWVFLPGGLLMQYGFYGKVGALGTGGTIQFPIPFTNPPFSVVATLKRTSSGNQAYSISSTPTQTQFQFLTETGASDGIYWHAIGV